MENVALPIQFSRNRKFTPQQRAVELLQMLDMGDRLHHRPNQLSGGQQQRVAIARALANNPPLIMCDEPTGNLDTVSGALVIQALRDVQEQTNTTVIMVTHDMDLAAQADRVLPLIDGRIVDEVDPRSTAQMRALKELREERERQAAEIAQAEA
jgi:ABC-type lipoprotein export system ATPase subunit